MDEEEIQLLYLLKEASAVAGYDADCMDHLVLKIGVVFGSMRAILQDMRSQHELKQSRACATG
jgi:hypothetical protein